MLNSTPQQRRRLIYTLFSPLPGNVETSPAADFTSSCKNGFAGPRQPAGITSEACVCSGDLRRDAATGGDKEVKTTPLGWPRGSYGLEPDTLQSEQISNGDTTITAR